MKSNKKFFKGKLMFKIVILVILFGNFYKRMDCCCVSLYENLLKLCCVFLKNLLF